MILKRERPKWQDPHQGRVVHFPELQHREVEGTMDYGKPVIRLITEFRCLLCGGWHEMIQGREELLGKVSGEMTVRREGRTVQFRAVDHHGTGSHIEQRHVPKVEVRLYTTKKWVQLVGARCAAQFRSLVDQDWRMREVVDGRTWIRLPYLPVDLGVCGLGAYCGKDGMAREGGITPQGPLPEEMVVASMVPKGMRLVQELL